MTIKSISTWRIFAAAALVMGCLAAPGSTASASALEPASMSSANNRFWSAPCNLGEEWDSFAESRSATYQEPTLPSASYLRKYGPAVANEACSNAEILQWQRLRRERDESDEICKIAWVVDASSTVFDLGCVRPLVVIEP